jgi:hypothetical protein
MKRAALVALLFSVALLEIYVCTIFLPRHRQQTYATSTVLSHCRPASERVTTYHFLGAAQ